MLKLLEEELFLLKLLSRIVIGAVCLLLLEENSECLCILEVDHIVFIASFVASDRLVRSISPITVNSELVLVSAWLKNFSEDMSRRLLTHACIYWLSKPSSNLIWLSNIDLFHLLSLPVVELSTDLDVLPTKAPLKHILNFIEKLLSLLLE